MKARCFILIFSLIIWTASINWAAVHDIESRIYKMTATEVEEVVTDWLKNHGFEVVNQSRSDQLVDLLAQKDQKQLHILAQRHSPLAARVQIETISGAAQSSAAALQHYLDGYINLPNILLDAEPSSIPALVRSHHKVVVCLFVAGPNEEIQITGVIVDKAGLILCTGHDLGIDESVSILLNDGREIEGRVIKIDRQRDLALIHAETPFDAQVPLRSGRFMLQNGDRLYAITCPSGSIVNIEPGFLDGPPRRVAGMPLWQVQMHIAHGSSGSPVFDSQGRMAAIVKGRFRGTDSVGFLIPFEIILQFLEKY
jgi:serine protease Do